jgi:hypothetical protein
MATACEPAKVKLAGAADTAPSPAARPMVARETVSAESPERRAMLTRSPARPTGMRKRKVVGDVVEIEERRA